MAQYPALEKFIADGSVTVLQLAPKAVIKEVQTILSCGADGIAGPKTLAAFLQFKIDHDQGQPGILGGGSAKLLLEQAKKAKSAPASSGKTYLRLTKTERYDSNGLRILLLEYVKNGAVKDTLEVCSGQAYAQNFRTGKQSRSGSMEPIPEGIWTLSDIHWANGRDNYDGAVFGDGLGPASISLGYEGWTERAAIEIHIDWNAGYAPGTAGCLGIKTIKDYARLVGWLRESDPKYLYVDWNLGTCPNP